ncbi:hypothetical protein GPECTOR_1g124 [Gonium pectorale]|uniref:Tc1-like transposase DDE domain-containing protein n=1 Tax=Gonium pectorale TaxID=33097 RepID=A0A150H1X0_GONPE|nr:hypothetical protein GPECTOR_1g124 [Gonium pectorale]|eukprot:KXZ56146.1 hypothetical protein GPECTOR_1g124 [Gonium pectorale]
MPKLFSKHKYNSILTTRFREANESDQESFRAYVRVNFRKEQLIWLDESAVNSKTFLRTHGRAQRGQRTKSKIPRSKGRRHSVLPIVTSYGLLDWYIAEGSINTDRMKDFIQRCLARHLRPYPEPNSVVIMDNCRIHKGEEVVSMIEATGAIVLFLPPYSPILNPAELIFSEMKAKLRELGKPPAHLWLHLNALRV